MTTRERRSASSWILKSWRFCSSESVLPPATAGIPRTTSSWLVRTRDADANGVVKPGPLNIIKDQFGVTFPPRVTINFAVWAIESSGASRGNNSHAAVAVAFALAT